jgi:DNA-3-methyladenine glycosylase II
MATRPLQVKLIKPAYWEEACKHLAKKDRVMRRLIPQFGDVCLESRGDAFVTLARSIVGQQISVKAAQSVWDRFAALSKSLTPANVLKLKVDDMRASGLSARKVEYLVDLALHFSNGTVHTRQWADMDDEASSTNWWPSVALAVGPPRCFSSFICCDPMCCRWMMWASSMASATTIFQAKP